MPHDVNLITTLAAGFGLALLLGMLASRLRMPPLVGYLLAGVAIGPATPGFVADVVLAGQLAEVGVMLLMFGVGLHFSLDDLLSVRRIALPGALVQIGVATLMGAGLGLAWGWPLPAALVFGLALSVASTVVLLRALEARGELGSSNGRIAVGWLVVEDLVMVLVLVLLPPLAQAWATGGQAPGAAAALWKSLALTLLQVVAFVLVMLVVGRRVFPRLLWLVARTGSRELFTLCVVAAAVGVAVGAASLFQVSYALGAFFAGMMLRESEYSHRAAEESLPLRDAFAVLFFVSVGMLFDPRVLLDQPGAVLAVVAVILLGKTLAAVALVLWLGRPLGTALTVGASLAQIGEFSFILASLGRALGVLPAEAQSLILAGAMVSVALNAGLFALLPRIEAALLARWAWARHRAEADDPLAALPAAVDPSAMTDLVVVIGHGRIGATVVRHLQALGRPVIVAERQRELVEQLRSGGVHAVCGDAVDPVVLVQAHVARARQLVLTGPDSLAARQLVALARELNPAVEVLACCDHADEVPLLAADRIEAVCPEQALSGWLLERLSRGLATR